MKLATKVEPNKTKLEALAKIGWQYIEVWTDESIVESVGAISLLNEYDFEYAVHSPTDYFDMTVVDFAGHIGAKIINTHKIVPNEDLARYVAYAKEKGITVTVENEAFPESHHLDKDGKVLPIVKTYDPVRSAGDFYRLVEEVPDVKLCVDVEHAAIRFEWPQLLFDCKSYLGHIHLCGYQGKEHHRPVYENMSLVAQLIPLLRAAKYEGFIVCEHDIQFHNEEVWTKTLKECSPLFGNQYVSH